MSTFKPFCSFFDFFKIKLISGKERLVLIIPFLGIVIKFPKSYKGSKTNFREYHFWKKYKNPFCLKTYLSISFPSLRDEKRYWVNIQKIGYRPCLIDQDNFFIQTIILTRQMCQMDGHHFEQPSNFCFDKKGRLQMVDYGHVQTQKVIKEYGTKLHMSFDENITNTLDDLEAFLHTLESAISFHKSHKN